MQFLCELYRELFETFKLKWVRGTEGIYAKYIQKDLSSDFQIISQMEILKGGEKIVSLIILTENCLLFQIPINYRNTYTSNHRF